MNKLAFFILVIVSSGACAENSGLKAGLWEVKPVRQVVDGRDMTAQIASALAEMQQAMAGMTPDQRKQMAAMMKGMGAGPFADGGLPRICISPAMAARNTPMIDPEGRCAPAKVTRSGTRSTFEFNCTANGHTMAGSGESTASGDAVSTRLNMTMTGSMGSHAMQSEMQMTYLGADCQGITPADQFVKDFQSAAPQK